MTAVAKPVEALHSIALARNDVSDSPNSIASKDMSTEEHIEVAGGRSDNEYDMPNHIENAVTDSDEDTQIPTQDGGLRAWLQVLGSFLVFSNIWGFTLAFGI